MGSAQGSGSGLYVQITEHLENFTNFIRAYIDAIDPKKGGVGTPEIAVNDGDPKPPEDGQKTTVAPTEIVNAAGEQTATLEIAKMEESLKPDGSLIIDDDEDRFYVRVKHASGAGGGTITISTVDNPDPAYDNPEVRMTLHVDGGDLITKSMILVADTVDDAYPGLADEVGANNQDDDRSHLIQLEGSVRVSEVALHHMPVFQANVRAKVEVEDTVHVNIVVFDVSGTTPEAVANHFDTVVRERFAQIGIDVQTENVEGKPWDANEFGPHTPFYIRQAHDDPDQDPRVYVPQGVKNLISNHQSNSPNTINVFVVASLFAVDEDLIRIRRLKGVAFHRSIAWEYLDAQFRNSVFMAKDNDGLFGFWTPSHELGHMTTDKVHYGTEYPNPAPPAHTIDHNLMQRMLDNNQLVTGPKRLYHIQKGNHHHQEP